MMSYKIKFNNNVPLWIDFDNIGCSQAYPKFNVSLQVYEKRKMIYAVKLDIDGYYYCCGSKNFEINEIKKTIIKECDPNILEVIYTELQNNYNNIFVNTVLSIYKSGIFDELCGQ